MDQVETLIILVVKSSWWSIAMIYVVTPHVSKAHDYVNHIFMRP
jgi:hypothetical protein